MWRVKFIGKDLKALFNIIGISSLLGCAFVTLLMLFRIVTQGYFFAEEPDQLILYIEIIVSVFGLGYSLYLFKRFLGEAKK